MVTKPQTGQVHPGHPAFGVLVEGTERLGVELQAAAFEIAARLVRVVPEPRVLGPVVQLGETPVRGVPVKDASSAAPTTF